MAHLNIFNLRNAMITFGVNDVNVFLGDTPAFRLATDIFGDDLPPAWIKHSNRNR